jgi:hypothetical protein
MTAILSGKLQEVSKKSHGAMFGEGVGDSIHDPPANTTENSRGPMGKQE